MFEMREGWLNYIKSKHGMIKVAQIVSKKTTKTEILYCKMTPALISQ